MEALRANAPCTEFAKRLEILVLPRIRETRVKVTDNSEIEGWNIPLISVVASLYLFLCFLTSKNLCVSMMFTIFILPKRETRPCLCCSTFLCEEFFLFFFLSSAF